MPRIAIAVHDFDAAVRTFRNVFGLPVADFSGDTVPGLGAHVGMCMPPGGSNIELMAPSDPTKPLSQSLQKFLDRRGEGPYALMLEAPDPDAEADELLARGMAVLPLMAGAGGRDIHPTSTHGVLIRVYPDDSVKPIDGLTSLEPSVSGIMRAVIATPDAAAAAETYRAGLGLAVDNVVEDGDRGVASAICRPPKGGTIELVSCSDNTRPDGASVEAFVAEAGGGLHQLVLETEDVAATRSAMIDRGAVFDEGSADGGAITVFGMSFIVG